MIILQAIYYALPMYLANMAPVLMKWLPYMNTPIDGGRMYKGNRLFGDHKTWRGLIFGVVFGMLTIHLQRWLGQFSVFADLELLNYGTQNAMLLGGLMGLGALLGDMGKSFFKRRLNRKSGSAWVPFDQLDFVIGGLLFSAPVFWPGMVPVLVILLLTPFLHYLSNLISFKLGLKNVPW